MSKKHIKVCITLSCIKHFLVLPSIITACISISPFSSLIDVLIGNTSSVIGLKICTIAAEIKK